jgi:GNAT superfamily N-acetyltransferase
MSLEKRHPLVQIMNTRPGHAKEAAAMQRLIYPTLTEDELYTEHKFLKHIELFPEGQFVGVVTVNNRPVIAGSTSTFRTNFDFKHVQHTYLEAVAHGWLTNHNPKGEWLYGGDMAVHPDYRGMKIGSSLYKARRELVKRLNLRGELAGGMLPSYEKYRHQMTIEEYVEALRTGKATCSTTTMQIKNGFSLRDVLYDHITDPRSNNCAVLLVRENPDYRKQHFPTFSRQFKREEGNNNPAKAGG